MRVCVGCGRQLAKREPDCCALDTSPPTPRELAFLARFREASWPSFWVALRSGAALVVRAPDEALAAAEVARALRAAARDVALVRLVLPLA